MLCRGIASLGDCVKSPGTVWVIGSSGLSIFLMFKVSTSVLSMLLLLLLLLSFSSSKNVASVAFSKVLSLAPSTPLRHKAGHLNGRLR